MIILEDGIRRRILPHWHPIPRLIAFDPTLKA